jgi:hypothetical protein
LNTVDNIDVSDSKCKYTSKIIVRNLRLVVSPLYRMAIPWPWVTGPQIAYSKMKWKISKWNYVYNGKSHLRTDIAICDVIIAHQLFTG